MAGQAFRCSLIAMYVAQKGFLNLKLLLPPVLLL